MSAPLDDGILIDAQNKIQQARELIHGLRLAGGGLLSENRDTGNAIAYIADLARNRLDKAERKIERYREGLRPTREAP